jgi:hypothetical protein
MFDVYDYHVYINPTPTPPHVWRILHTMEKSKEKTEKQIQVKKI